MLHWNHAILVVFFGLNVRFAYGYQVSDIDHVVFLVCCYSFFFIGFCFSWGGGVFLKVLLKVFLL